MNYITMTQRIADNLFLLSTSDGVTIIDGDNVTQAQIKNKINDIYREELFPMFSDKFPDDFKQGTYPLNTYTNTNTVSTSTSGFNLISNSPAFANSMEGFTVQNPTLSSTAKIVTFNSSTSVTLDTNIGTTWNNNTFYVLGNEYTFGGDTTDIKEVKDVFVKYANTDTYFRRCVRIDYDQALEYGNEYFSKALPMFYLTSVTIGGVPTQAIGILPYPTDYQGKLKFLYIQRPPALNADTDSPLLSVAGISEVIINGVTAWGKMQQTKPEESKNYYELYLQGMSKLITNYKPKTRSNPSVLRTSNYANAISNRRI